MSSKSSLRRVTVVQSIRPLNADETRPTAQVSHGQIVVCPLEPSPTFITRYPVLCENTGDQLKTRAKVARLDGMANDVLAF